MKSEIVACGRMFLFAAIFCLGAWLPARGQDQPTVYPQLGHIGQICAAGFIDGGHTLLSGGSDGIRVWDVATGREGLSPGILGCKLAWSARSEIVATWHGQDEDHIRVYDARSKQLLLTAPFGTGGQIAFALSPDGRELAVGEKQSADRGGEFRVKVWSVSSGRELAAYTVGKIVGDTLEGLEVHSLAFSPDGRLLAIGGEGRLLLWDLRAGRAVQSFEEDDPDDSIRSKQIFWLAFSPDGRSLVSGILWGLTIRDVATGRELRRLKANPDQEPLAVAFSPDGTMLAAANNLWSVATGALLRTFNSAKFAAFSPDGHSLAAVDGRQIALFDPRTGKRIGELGPRTNLISAIAASPDGRIAAATAGDIELWDIRQARPVLTLHGEAASPVSALAFSSDGYRLFAGSDNGALRLWDVEKARQIASFAGHSQRIGSLALSPDGRTLASASWDGSVKLWNIETRQEKTHILADNSSGEQSQVFSVAFAPDGKTLAWSDHATHVWDLATDRERYATAIIGGFANTLRFTADGRYLALGVDDTDASFWGDQAISVRLLDAANGRELWHVPGESEGSIAIAPDGRTIATGDGEIKLIETASGKIVRSFGRDIDQVAFMADDRYLVSTGWDGALRIWDPATGKEKVAFISFTDGSYLAITPEGYYDASSESAEESLNVRIGNEVTGIDAYREKFYRPDLVRLSLEGGSLANFARLDQIKPAPKVEIVDLPDTAVSAELAVKVRITNTGGGIGEVRLYQMGATVVDDTSGVGAVAPGASVLRNYTVRLVDGPNELQAFAFNDDNSMRSNPGGATVLASIAPTQPALHGVIVGIQEFKNPEFKLAYPIADAQLLAQTLRQYAAPLFRSVDLKVLTTPEETTRANLIAVLGEARKSVNPNDLFVFFVASHGVVDEDEYYLVTSNVGSASTERLKADALSQDDLRNLLGNIPATKKLTIIDTCQSGAALGPLQTALLSRGLSDSTAMKILSRAVGSTVLSASVAQQYAVEGYQGHGLLTYVIAQGLAGKADADHDGFVSTLELATYVDEQVPSIAEQAFHVAQYPAVSPSGQGFPLARVH